MRISDLSSDLCSSDLEGDDVLADRVDVALLAAGLGPHRLALGHAQHLGGEHLSRALVGTHHRHAATHGAGVETVALLDQDYEVLQKLGDRLCVVTVAATLVSADVEGHVRRTCFTGSHARVQPPQEGRLEVGSVGRDLHVGSWQNMPKS